MARISLKTERFTLMMDKKTRKQLAQNAKTAGNTLSRHVLLLIQKDIARHEKVKNNRLKRLTEGQK